MKKKMKLLIFIPLIFLFSAPTFEHKNETFFYTFSSDKKLEVGEELTYVVNYSFWKLGEVKTKIIEKEEIDGKTFYKTLAYIDSYNGIPFVDLHQIYKSTLNQNYYSSHFRGLIKYEDYTSYTDYFFHYDSSYVRIQKGKINPPQVWTDSTAEIHKQYRTGFLYFFMQE